jgi:hypothetical protein
MISEALPSSFSSGSGRAVLIMEVERREICEVVAAQTLLIGGRDSVALGASTWYINWI